MDVPPEGEQNPPVARENKGTSKSLMFAAAVKRPDCEDARGCGVGNGCGGGGGGGCKNPLFSDFSSLIRKVGVQRLSGTSWPLSSMRSTLESIK